MKSLAFLTAFLALVATITSGAFLLPVSSASAAEPARDLVKRQGVLSNLRVDWDGSVFFQLEERNSKDSDAKPRRIWFRSPADLSEVISVEEMVLDVLLFTDPNQILTVAYEEDRRLSGESPEGAFPLRQLQRSN